MMNFRMPSLDHRRGSLASDPKHDGLPEPLRPPILTEQDAKNT